MSVKNGVVAHFLDGTVLKGTTHDFSPNRSVFHVSPIDRGPTVETRWESLKALFFVKDLEGDPLRADLRGFIRGPSETVHGKKIAVRFSDGELVCGYSLSYSPRREGFFIFPADSGSNNMRIFVVAGAATAIAEGMAAEELAQKVLSSRAA